MQLPQLIDATLEYAERVALLTLNRDDIRNALTGTRLVDDLIAATDWCNRNPEISALIITGAGKAFSAGGNIKEMRDRRGLFSGSAAKIQQQYRDGIQQMALALHRCEVPLIAAVNGPAIGAGMDLACMCDLRIGADSASFGSTFINLGIIPGDGGAWFLQRLLGYQQSAELLLTGQIIDAGRAEQIGLLLDVVPQQQLLPHARQLAGEIAAKPPLAVRLCKHLLKSAGSLELAEFLDQCAGFQGMLHHTEDHLEAVCAFLEKRPPSFTGR